MRTEILLQKDWVFTDMDGVSTAVDLPHTWNAIDGQDGGNDYRRGRCHYKKTFPCPEFDPEKQCVYLEFQGVNASALVELNGKFVIAHDGGYSTFRQEVTKFLQAENTLTVAVDNGVNDRVYPQKADFTFYGGIYRDVKLIVLNKSHFDLDWFGGPGIAVDAKPEKGRGEVTVRTWHEVENARVQVKIFDGEGNVVAEGQHTCANMTVENVRLWDGIHDPYLYRCEATLLENGEEVDKVSCSFGFRSYHFDPKKGFFLNGRSYPLYGVSRHQDRKGIGNALTRAHHDEDMALIREMGATTIRLAHYQHDQYFYDLCDKHGLVVWAEIPYISEHMPAGRENTVSQMKELIVQNYNHPSIFVWGLCNEITIGGYSDELNDNIRSLHALCKVMDPSRLTTIAQLGSVAVNSDHVMISDVQSYNYYFGWYSGTVEQNGEKMDAWHAANPDKCYGISEYGADNYTCWHSASPFNHDYTEEYAVTYHHEMLKTFATRPYLWATHVWNMFDFAVDTRDEGGFKGLNAKGLVSFDRKIRKDSFYIYQAYWTKEPMVHISGRRFYDRAPGERSVMIMTNQDAVTLTLNGQVIGTQEVVDHVAVFEELPLVAGENTLVATTAGATDTITLNGVGEHNGDYDLPDIMAAVNAGNWFVEQSDEGEMENYYNIDMPGGQVLANEECLRLIRGWLMSNNDVSFTDKMTVVSRLPNYQAMWGDRTIAEIPLVKRRISEEAKQQLDRMLRRVPKPE